MVLLQEGVWHGAVPPEHVDHGAVPPEHDGPLLMLLPQGGVQGVGQHEPVRRGARPRHGHEMLDHIRFSASLPRARCAARNFSRQVCEKELPAHMVAMGPPTLTDDSGREIDCIVSDPDDDEYLSNTAFMLPTSPMSRGTTYTATMVVEWDGIEETITATFTTAP